MRKFLAAALSALVLGSAACSAPSAADAPPRASAPAPDPAVLSTVDPSFVQGTDNSAADRLAAAAVTDVQAFWRQTFPTVFGRPWRDLRQFRSVDTADAGVSSAPPCTSTVAEIAGNAQYCGSADTVSWDRSALVPVLREKYGAVAVLVVLAHEIGHAVQQRSGVVAGSRAYPTIVTEAMADCYSGTAVRWLADGHGAHLRPGKAQLDKALQALVTFRDPVGRAATGTEAHGDAFDRVTAFADGYQSGAGLCKGITAQNRTFTQARFIDMDDATSGGNLGYDELISKLTPDITAWLRTVRPGFVVPHQVPAAKPCGGQGPAAYCPGPGGGTIQVSGALRTLHQRIGDWATGTLLATRYGLALRAARDQPVHGPAAGTGALCVAGAYTGALLARTTGFALSPGDLDESVRLLLDNDDASRDVAGSGITSGFDRVLAFRAGLSGGAAHC